MRTPARPIHDFAASLLLAITLTGCAAERTAAFTQGQEIPLRILSLRISDWEVVPESRPPLSSLSAPEGEKSIAVFLRWDGLDDYAAGDRRYFVESFLESNLALVDSDGFHVDAFHAMPRDFYYGSAYTLEASPDWVVVFHVWVDSTGHSLRVRHPDPGEEDFDVAIVPLA